MSEHLDSRTYEEKAQLLFENARIANIVVLIIVGIMTATLLGQIPDAQVYVWCMVISGLTLTRIALLLWRDRKPDAATPRNWVMRYGAITALMGLCWAWFVFLGYGVNDRLDLMVLIVIIGMTALAMPALISFPAIVFLYFAPAGLSVAIQLLLDPALDKTMLGVAMLAFNAMIVRSTFNFHRVLTESLRLRFSNAELNQQLEAEIAERKDMETELKRLALHDPLTGIYNRQAMEQRAESEIVRARRYRHPLSVFMIDIDHFKRINDTYGHSAGDAVLIAFADNLGSTTRSIDILARYGGEEFVVLLPESNLETALQLAERIREQISAMPVSIHDGEQLHVTISIGVASLSEHADTFDALLDDADKAMYAAKASGRNCVCAAGAITANDMGVQPVSSAPL